MKTLRYLDLFAGIGGFRIGFEQACTLRSLEPLCVLTSEIKPQALHALRSNFPDISVSGDITRIHSEDISDFDVLLGGFPCQAFSIAGKKKGFEDTRGTLFFEIFRILRDKKPKGFILENVDALVTHDRKRASDRIGRTFEIILSSLESLGYKVSWRILECWKFGVPQRRKRVFITGSLYSPPYLLEFREKAPLLSDILQTTGKSSDSEFCRNLLSRYPLESLYGKHINDKRGEEGNIHSWDLGVRGEVTPFQKRLLESILKERRRKEYARETGIDFMDGMPLTFEQIRTFCSSPDLQQNLDRLVEMGYLRYSHPKKLLNGERVPDTTKLKGYNIINCKFDMEFSRILNPYGLCPTLTATEASYIGVPDSGGIRRLTLREGLDLFGFPRTYSLDSTMEEYGYMKTFDLLGNTVVVPTVREVALRLFETFC